MRLTRQAWGCYTLVVTLAALGAIFARPVLFAGSAMIGVWMLTQQYLFVRELASVIHTISVTQSLSETSTMTGNSTAVTLGANLKNPTKLHLKLTDGVPPAATIDEPLRLAIEGETTYKTQANTVSWPVAGSHEFRSSRLTASDGFFSETLSLGSTPTVIVEPPSPRNIHIGAGGTRVPLVQGDHGTGRTGSGLEPTELREYAPGDTARQIDWKATARLATPHVRTYEAETDQPTMIIVDHRDHLAMGPMGETKLDYLREIGLTIAASARQLGDPLGYVTVGNEGITGQIQPTMGMEAYTRIRRELLELEPTAHVIQSSSKTQTGTDPKKTEISMLKAIQKRGSPKNPTNALALLTSSENRFTEQLRPFYEKQTVYNTRIQTNPFSTAVEFAVAKRRRGMFIILCTDDSNPSELKTTVRLARTNGSTVMVLLTPTVLFESGGLADAETAYESYRSFEKLRHDLDQLDGVSALEVGPSDRLAAILASGGNR